MNLESTFVGFADILGFKDIVNNNSQEDLVKLYETFGSATEDSLGLFQFKKNKEGKIETDLSDVKINSLIISDSVLFWTDDLTIRSFYDIMQTTRFFLAYGIFLGIPVRAAISNGPLSVIRKRFNTNSINEQVSVFGKGLVNAYEKEASQNWSGGFIDTETIKLYHEVFEHDKHNYSDVDRISCSTSIDSLIKKGFIKPYPVPLKNKTNSEEMTINWASVHRPKLSIKTVRESFSRNNKRVDRKVEEMIEETIKYSDSFNF